MEDVYKRLAVKLNQMPNGFPETPSGVELRILKKIFTPEEAETALKIRAIPETVEAIAGRLGALVPEMQAILDNMVNKGQIASAKMYGSQVYIFMPFIIGIYEFQMNRMDKELAQLIEEYAPALMNVLGTYGPALTRVIPVNEKIDARHEVLPYENVRSMLEQAKSFQLVECICRKERAMQGHPCKHPLEVCMGFSNEEGAFDRYPKGKRISREEALEVMELSEKEGLVHSTYNVAAGHMYLCNCCSCCCGLLIGLNRFKAPHLIAGSNFVASIDSDTCIQCGTCLNERCPVQAIAEKDNVFVVQPDRCIGCGVCTSTCPTESIKLVRKPEALRDEPPANLLDWYIKRAESRGIKISID